MFGFAAFRRQLLIFAGKPQIDVCPLRFVPLSAALKITKKPEDFSFQVSPQHPWERRENTKKEFKKNKEGRLNSGKRTDLRAQTEVCFVLADCRWFFTASLLLETEAFGKCISKQRRIQKREGDLKWCDPKCTPPQKTLQGKWFALRKSEILRFQFSKFPKCLIPRFCRPDLGWIFYFGLANSRKIASEFLSEFWWRIFLANFSALFFQGFRPSQKIHTQNSRPKCFWFSSRRVSTESNRSGPPKKRRQTSDKHTTREPRNLTPEVGPQLYPQGQPRGCPQGWISLFSALQLGWAKSRDSHSRIASASFRGD